MKNQAMHRKLRTQEAIDVRAVGDEVEPGVFRLREFVDDVDYLDTLTERWIVSIGQRKTDGAYFAATDDRYYHHSEFECVWLR